MVPGRKNWLKISKKGRLGRKRGGADPLDPTSKSASEKWVVNKLAVQIKHLNAGIKVGDRIISILLFADDIVLLAENEENLQCMISELVKWCSQWRMVVNPEKTEVIHFRKKRIPKTTTTFKLGEITLDVVSFYKYLGCTINEYLESTYIGNILSEGASRALGKLLSKFYKNKGLGYKTYTKLYETCVCPVMDYGSGVWGYCKNEKLDKIHQRAMRCFLGVGKYAALAGIEGDLAWYRYTPQTRRMIEMLRFWNRIVKMSEERLPKLVYN